MKYATPLFGLAILVASLVAASACDSLEFICGRTRVSIVGSDGSAQCNKLVEEGMYAIGDKTYPASSKLFRFDQRSQTLRYRGRRCTEVQQ